MEELLDNYEHSELAIFHDQFYMQLREEASLPNCSIPDTGSATVRAISSGEPERLASQAGGASARRASANSDRLESIFHRSPDLRKLLQGLRLG